MKVRGASRKSLSVMMTGASLIMGVLILSGWQQVALRAFEFSGYAQGTSYHITYFADTKRVVERQLDSIFSSVDSSLSIYKPYSRINAFNKSIGGVTVDRHMKMVVAKSLAIFHDSGGLFDITVYPIVQAWGFGSGTPPAVPDSARIREIMPCVGSDKIYFEGNFLHKKVACVQLDVNGIAQGYTVDVIADFLEMNGIVNYLVEVGGELRVRGTREPEHVPIRIGIENPAAEGMDVEMKKVISIPKGAITTSGTYRKQRQTGKSVISHLMDPRTGYPLNNEMISVTVVAPNALTADGYDNVLMSLGVQGTLTFLKHHPDLEAYMTYRNPNGTFAEAASPGFVKLEVKNP